MVYRLNDHHGHKHGPVSNVQKLTTQSDIYWDGETTFVLGFPCFYVEARTYNPHTVRARRRRDNHGWPSPTRPDHIDQKRVDWRDKETSHTRHLGENHDGVQFMPTPFGLACTGRENICHDYAPRGRWLREKICVNCIHRVVPIKFWDEHYRKVQMRIWSLERIDEETTKPYLRWKSDFQDITIGDDPRQWEDGNRRDQHIIRVHLSEDESLQNMQQLDLWYDVKIRAPYVYMNSDREIRVSDDYTGAPNPGADEIMLYRPRTDTVSKGRIFIDPSVINRQAIQETE